MLLPALTMLLASCATNGHVTKIPQIIDTSCEWVHFIYISKDDVLTDGTARQILNHNETLEKNCSKL
ncbi:hypothetical protein ABO04_04920 [Nitrosomonas sp. HPC101]|nr:hypothetical protein [Nitrosomonas sp. HPC101]